MILLREKGVGKYGALIGRESLSDSNSKRILKFIKEKIETRKYTECQDGKNDSFNTFQLQYLFICLHRNAVQIFRRGFKKRYNFKGPRIIHFWTSNHFEGLMYVVFNDF